MASQGEGVTLLGALPVTDSLLFRRNALCHVRGISHDGAWPSNLLSNLLSAGALDHCRSKQPAAGSRRRVMPGRIHDSELLEDRNGQAAIFK